MVSFPDIPEALTGAATKVQALELAADALTTAIECYFEDHRPVPVPSAPRRGQMVIDLPPSLSVKVLLLNEMIAQGAHPADPARRMNARP